MKFLGIHGTGFSAFLFLSFSLLLLLLLISGRDHRGLARMESAYDRQERCIVEHVQLGIPGTVALEVCSIDPGPRQMEAMLP